MIQVNKNKYAGMTWERKNSLQYMDFMYFYVLLLSLLSRNFYKRRNAVDDDDEINVM